MSRTFRSVGKEDSHEQNELCRSLRNAYDDRERMAKFYQEAFGWQTRMLGEEMGNYVLATTTETDESGPKKPGAINGGFFPKRPDWPAQHPSLVIAVDDIQGAMKNVAEAGGKVLGEPMEIPGVGQYVSFFDPEGNRVSMLQPVPRSWHAPNSE
jgi:predicted enzyme related to lactoylglutathione lyase